MTETLDPAMPSSLELLAYGSTRFEIFGSVFNLIIIPKQNDQLGSTVVALLSYKRSENHCRVVCDDIDVRLRP